MSNQGNEFTVNPASKSGMFSALNIRNFRLVFFGQCLSVIGDGAYVTILGWYAFTLSGASWASAIVLGTVSITKLLTMLFGGALADRYDRRRLMILTDVARGLALTLLAIAAFQEVTSLALLVVVAGVVGLFDALFTPSFMGVVPGLVDKSSLTSANALIGFVRSARGIAGPAIGGALYAGFGPEVVFALDAATFFVAALLVTAATVKHSESTKRARKNIFRDIVEGARYVALTPILALSIPVAAIAMMLSDAPTQALLPQLVQEHLVNGVGTLGALETALGIGMACGAMLCAWLHPARYRAVLTYSAWAAAHLMVALMAMTHSVPLAILLFFIKGILTGFGVVLWETLLMELIPQDKLSRVFSVDTFGSSGMMPVGFALAGILVSTVPAAQLIFTGQAIAAALMISLLLVKRIRTVQ